MSKEVGASCQISLGKRFAGPTLHPFITIDPGRRGGRPCVRDLRISVGDVLGWLAQGMSPVEIMADYPELTHAVIQAWSGSVDRRRVVHLCCCRRFRDLLER